jgi:hypothetical protein
MPAPKNYVKIQYPRKCNHCDYVSNNPQMWHYHNKTHSPIPTNQLCDHGCKSLALFLGTGGKYTCLQIAQQCPEYIKGHSARIKKQWENDGDRKEKTKELFIKRVQTPEVVEKMKATKRKKSGLLTPEDAKNYRHYARAIRERAQMWAKSQGYVLGQQTYHVDHKFSILDSWHANLPAEIVNHPANLQILEAKENSSKGSKSCITLTELFELTQGTS